MKIIYWLLGLIIEVRDTAGNKVSTEWYFKWRRAVKHWRKWLQYEGMPDRVRTYEGMAKWNRDLLDLQYGGQWIIWSFEHKAYWGPNARGYVERIEDAGLYLFDEARTIVENANKYHGEPFEAMMPVWEGRKSDNPEI